MICSDGTGQSSNDPNSSNVFQLCSLLDLTDPKRQVAGYDAGVGTVADRKMIEAMKKEKKLGLRQS
ncbi:MAG: phospholipase effector Tle1 domain-containing protein [Gammaproteobacteria bacterium]